MSKTPVDDFGLEILRKSATDSSADDSKYALYVKQDDEIKLNRNDFIELIKYHALILQELKVISYHLSKGSDEEISIGELCE